MATVAVERKIERAPWPAFRSWLRRNVKAGEHAVIVGSTGSGKSYLAREVVPMFGRNIVILDGKGGDDPSLKIPGFTHVYKWPPPDERWGAVRGMVTGEKQGPIRVLLTRPIKTADDFAHMRILFEQALRDLFPRKGKKVFALYVDEMQIIADPREGMGLGRYIGPLLRTKRYHGMSVVTATQYPTWIPKSSYRESTHRWLFPIRDEESQEGLGRIAGNRKLIIPILDSLKRYEFLYYHAPTGRYVVSKVGS
jgi:hypothetical protein